MFYAIDTTSWKTFEGKTLTSIKRQASKHFNKKKNVFDTLVIQYEHDLKHKFTMVRTNKIYPNNIIERGKWK